MRYGYIRNLELRRVLLKRDWALDVAEAEEMKTHGEGKALHEKLEVLVLAERELTSVMDAQGVTAVMCDECEQMHPHLVKAQRTCPRCLSMFGRENRLARYEHQVNLAGEARNWASNNNWKNATCAWCGGAFLKKRKSHKYCCSKCNMSALAEKNSAHKMCAMCGKPVPFGSKRVRYCSDDCNREAKRKRSRIFFPKWREKKISQFVCVLSVAQVLKTKRTARVSFVAETVIGLRYGGANENSIRRKKSGAR